LSGLACAVLGAMAASCSLIVNTSADQCKEDADCATSSFPGARTCQMGLCQAAPCSVDADCAAFAGATCVDMICSKPTSCTTDMDCASIPGTTCKSGTCQTAGCTLNAECVAQGQYFICRKDTHKCVNLQSELCTTVAGDFKNDNAFIFGSILPTQGSDMTTGVPVENSIKLAINDFTQSSNGLPPAPGSTANRPLALIGCNDNSDSDTTVKAATHLVDDVGVTAIIGAAYSGLTIKAATTVTIPKGVLLFSPSATSVAITDLADNGLVWRASPADSFQGAALQLYEPAIEAKVKANPMVTGSIKVAVLTKGDAYGLGLGSALEMGLNINGKLYSDPSNSGLYKRTDYGNPDDPATDPTKYPATVQDMVNTFKPHIIFAFGTNESITEIFEKIEEQWVETKYRPYYIFSDGAEVPDLALYVAAREAANATGSSDLRVRITGSVPGTDSALFKTFVSAYNGHFTDGTDPTVFGAAGAYDITYMLAYSAVANGSKPLTGANLAAGMAKLIPPGTPTDVGSNNINTAFAKLSANNAIDFNGASGPLNFDVKTGEAPSDIQIWCLSKDPSTGHAKAAVNSGQFYDAAAGKLSGTFMNCP
jgi:branched-chain amino acid transport system substrate-binding protein